MVATARGCKVAPRMVSVCGSRWVTSSVATRAAARPFPRGRLELIAVRAHDLDIDDAGLMARLVRGDRDAMRQLVTRYAGAVTATAKRILTDAHEAEDVAQETFVKLWQKSAVGGEAIPEPRAWLRRVAANDAIDRLRRAARLDVSDEPPDVESDAAAQDAVMIAGAASARVSAALGELPDRQRLALVLFHFEDMRQSEVAETLGVSDEAVESLLARGRRRLKSLLADDWRALVADLSAPTHGSRDD